MQRTKPPFRADHVGSILRTAAIKDARAKHEKKEITDAQLKEVEDREIEKIIKEELGDLAESSPIVGELRGRGAMMALEFVEPGSKKPNADAAKEIAAKCLEQGVVILTCGTFGNNVRLLPPLVIDFDLLRDGLRVFAKAIEEVGA